MEEIRRAAMTYYNTFPAEVKVSVDQFFDSMDANQDGKISYFEFSNFLTEEGYHMYNNPTFFDEIRTARSNSLNKADVITLYYIFKSQRPVCDACKRLITGLYFTCETCFKRRGNSFNIHSRCLESGEFRHRHAKFIDNYTLLTLTRSKHMSAENTSQVVSYTQASTSHPSPVVYVNAPGLHHVQWLNYPITPPQASSSSSTSLAIVPVQQPNNHHRKRRAAYKALENILTATSIVSNFCTIM